MVNDTGKKHHHRRSIRLVGYDYAAEGGYFIAMVTHGRRCLFGEVMNGEMKLNDFGKIVYAEWFRTEKLRPNVELLEDEFVVMPNHIHGIIWINGENGWGTARCAPTSERRFGEMAPNSLPTIVRSFKSAVTKNINLLRNTPGSPLWQRNNYEHIINSEKDYDNIANYIDSNPLNWEIDSENH